MLNPLAFARFLPISEGALEIALVCPDVLPETVRFSVSVIADVNVSVMKDLGPFAMLYRI
jgi:hypothetical protein